MSSSDNKPLKAQKIHFDGKLGQLYKIWILNFLYTLLTLGIYSFWGRTRMRKYIARCLTLEGDRFEYTGKGKELFLAFLKVSFIFAVLGGAYLTIEYFAHHVVGLPIIMDIINVIIAVIYIPTLFFLIYLALYGAMRYRLSKTRWRGIRFHLAGSSFSYALFSMGRTLLSIISLGMLIPKSSLERQKRMINNMSYGSLKFSMNYHKHNLNKSNIITLLLALPTLGLSRIWFHVALQKFVWDHTNIETVRFYYTMTPGKQIFLAIKAILILVLTLGFGHPIIIKMHLKAILDNMEIMGDLDSLKARQSEQPELTSGEGLEGILGDSFL